MTLATASEMICFFALGHSTVVVLAAIGVAVAAGWIRTRFPELQEVGGLVGTGISVLFLLAAAFLAAVSLTVLYRGNQLLNPGSGAARRVIVIFKTIDYRTTPFWGNVRDGVVSAGEDLGMNVQIRGPALESDVQGQIDIVRQAIREKPDAIVLAAADYNLSVPVAREVKSHGIPLVCIDSFINSGDADARIGTDSYEGGQKCAAALMRYVNEGDLVAVMS